MQLDPKVLLTIKNLPLLAKTVVDGFMNGFNKSTVKGPGLEFSQYRSYQPGDDLRWMDWRMYARSDRYYIRESEVETSISVKFLIDASASMNHNDGTLSKIEYAKYLSASLAYLASLSGDAVGLSVFNEGHLYNLNSRPDPHHLQRLYHQLDLIKPAGTFTNPVQYKALFSGQHRKELLVFVTDMYETGHEISHLLDSLSALRHEVIVFHLMGEDELNFDFKGYTSLQDLETGETVAISPQTKKNYQEKLETYMAEIKRRMLSKGITYRLLSTARPLDQALQDFLVQRNKGI